MRKHPQQELFDLAMAYYRLSKRAVEMELAQDRRGNRTTAYVDAQDILQHAKEHIWANIRACIVIDGIKNPDAVLQDAWEALQWQSRMEVQCA